MRIISGIRRGHKLYEFKGDDVRPTTDRVKENLFNIIQEHIPSARCLDMFAGSGALSMEAISRGASEAVCVDIDARSIDIIRKNVQSLGFSENCKIVNMSCFDYIRKDVGKFDLIFLDPPYNKNFIEPVLCQIIENDILDEDGMIVLESDDTDFHGELEGLDIYRQRKYGRTYITVYTCHDD
jgi:16S rRNA (guanine(966)-N(2))-methyltransferase RsmD